MSDSFISAPGNLNVGLNLDTAAASEKSYVKEDCYDCQSSYL